MFKHILTVAFVTLIISGCSATSSKLVSGKYLVNKTDPIDKNKSFVLTTTASENSLADNIDITVLLNEFKQLGYKNVYLKSELEGKSAPVNYAVFLTMETVENNVNADARSSYKRMQSSTVKSCYQQNKRTVCVTEDLGSNAVNDTDKVELSHPKYVFSAKVFDLSKKENVATAMSVVDIKSADCDVQPVLKMLAKETLSKLDSENTKGSNFNVKISKAELCGTK